MKCAQIIQSEKTVCTKRAEFHECQHEIPKHTANKWFAKSGRMIFTFDMVYVLCTVQAHQSV